MRTIPADNAGKLRLLREIMARELTALQRQTLEDYYLKGMTLEEIARERYVNKSTVQRTLKRAEGRIRRFLFLPAGDCEETVNFPGKKRNSLALSIETDIMSSERMGRSFQ